MRKLVLVFMLANAFFLLSVQGKSSFGTIEGVVLDENHLPLEGVNLVLFTSDSVFVTGVITDKDGKYIFQNIDSHPYIIRASMIGYKKESQKISLKPDQRLCLSPFQLKTDIQSLGDVVVTAKKPPMEISADKTVINLSSFNLSSSGNAYMVMQNMPGVFINNGSLSLNGKGKSKIMIDGKISYLEGEELINYLKSIPAASLDKIELIANPSAKYDASGNSGIINISTKHARISGFDITANSTYEQGKYDKYNNNISMNGQSGKFCFYGMFGYYRGKDFNKLNIYREFEKTDHSIFEQNSYRLRNHHNSYYNGNISYDFSDKAFIEWYINGNTSHRKENGTINSRFYVVQTDSTLTSATDIMNRNSNMKTGLNFSCSDDNTGRKLTASADYLYYSVKEDQQHDDTFFIPESGNSSIVSSKENKDGYIRIYSIQSDLIYPLQKNWIMEGGLKSTFVRVNSTSKYFNKQDTYWSPDNDLSRLFNYDENVNALYLNSKYNYGKFHVEAGLRMENTNIKGHLNDLIGVVDSLFKESYTNIFPSLYFSYVLSDQHTFNLILNRRIDRPNYRDLNPFTYVFDTYTYEQGNTSLKSQFTNNLDLSYVFRKRYSFGVFYSNVEDAIIKSYLVKTGSKRVYVTPTNMAGNYSYGLKMQVGQISFGKRWNSSIYMTLTTNNFRWLDNDAYQSNNKTTFMINLHQSFDLGKEWSADLSGFYSSKMALGQITVSPLWKISGTIQKKFCGKRLVLSIYSNDIFNSYIVKGKGLFGGNYAWTRERDGDNNSIGITLAYHFKKGTSVKKIKKESEAFDTKRLNL